MWCAFVLDENLRGIIFVPVSYTHLDVYKRQPYDGAEAAEYAQRAKDVNSKCAVAYLLRGDVALKLNDVNKASSDYNLSLIHI